MEHNGKAPCNWCKKERPNTSGICPHCHRFPLSLSEVERKSLEELLGMVFRTDSYLAH